MKKLILSGLLLFLGAFIVSAQDLPSIRIVNNTGYPVYNIYISPSENETWGEDFLGEDILENGQIFTCRLSTPLSEINVYDIGLEDEDGNAYFKWEQTLANDIRIVFTEDDLDEDY